jgi:hypothetical protein
VQNEAKTTRKIKEGVGTVKGTKQNKKKERVGIVKG